MKKSIYIILSIILIINVFAYEYDQGVKVEGEKVTFRLWAPGKQSVAVTGDFNDWSVTANLLEEVGEGYWETEISLHKGEFRYQYVLNGEKFIGDPYAEDVEWDEYGPNGVVKVGSEKFRWDDSNFNPVQHNDMIIYEMHLGDFTPHGTYSAAEEKIPYLKELGINTIKIMPWMEFPGDISWGYNPTYFFAPETAYGDPEDLKSFINECHKNGISVIQDMVFNHTAHDHPFNQIFDYYNSPWYSTDSNPWGMPDLNHWSDRTKIFVRDVINYWIREYHIDGIRYDYTRGIGWDGYNGVSFIAWCAREAGKDINKYIFQVAEHLPQDPEMVFKTEMDAEWHDSFHDQMKANLREGTYESSNYYGDLDKTMKGIDFRGSGFGDMANVVNYTESHDEERVIYESMTNPGVDYIKAVRKSRLGASVLFTSAGIPMIYHGQEFGMDTHRTIDPNKIKWDKLKSWPGDGLYQHYKKLIELRKNHMALRQNNIQEVYKYHDKKVLVYKRWDNYGDIIIVVANFSDSDQYIDIPFPYNGTWYEAIYNYSVDVNNGTLYNHQIGKSDVKIFCLKKSW
jgi:1,4-alpha-glucan branching enzyme